ncbi:MAG: hypothetical protein J3K34DRAFT_522752 [Monoraphidium minutum]|nr:MAG: hypothetical protein J3K34DRAFT_522752 [Monoraphidium minutum]
MTSFNLRRPGQQQQLRPALAAFAGGDDDDAHGTGTAAAPSSTSRGSAAATASAPPPPSVSGSTEELKQRGVAAAEAGDYAAALHLFAQVLLNGEDARIEEMRAQVLLLLGRDYEAVQAAERSARMQPAWPDAWLTLARAQLNLGEPQLAVDSLQRLAAASPGHAALQKELPEALMLAARQRQQQGVRMHVLGGGGGGGGDGGGGGGGAAAAPGGDEGGGGGGGEDAAPMDGVDMTSRVYMPNSGAPFEGMRGDAAED